MVLGRGGTFLDWALVLLLNWPDWPWATHSISLLLSFQMQRECIPPGGLEVPLNLRFCSFIPWTLLIFLIPQIHQNPKVPFYYKWFLDLHPNNFLLLVEYRISHWALSTQVSNFPSLLKLQKRVRSPFQISRKTLWHPSMSFVSWRQYT